MEPVAYVAGLNEMYRSQGVGGIVIRAGRGTVSGSEQTTFP
jgi:hypothetical protein